MTDKNSGLEKLRKLKLEIERDLEKKTGKKRHAGPTKKRIELSDALRKRLTEGKSQSITIDNINTVIDLERYLSDESLIESKTLLRDGVQTVRNLAAIGTIEGLIDLLNKDINKADSKFSQLVESTKKDFVFFNYFLTKIIMGKELNQEMKAFYKQFQDSIYPFFILIFYTIFKTGSYASLRNILRVLYKEGQDILPELVTSMILHDHSQTAKAIGSIYRQNQFKDYQNIASALAYLANSNDDSYRRVIDAMEKKKNHRCSKIYCEYLTKEEINTDKTLYECPMGKFILAKKKLKNGNINEAKELSKELIAAKDPHGVLLQSSMLFASKDELSAYKVWYELLKPYKSFLMGWEAQSSTEFKGLGLERGSRSIRLEEFPMPDNVASFKAIIGKRLTPNNDFEIFLYPLEELRALYSPYVCQLYYSFN